MNRTRRTSKQMFPLIENYLSSEINQADFCQANGIALHVLGYWLKQYREQDREKKQVSFAPIEISKPENPHLQIKFPNGLEIKVPINC